MRFSCSLVALLLLTACISEPSKNEDASKNNQATYRKDLRECQEDYPETGSGVYLRQRAGCMQIKGWK